MKYSSFKSLFLLSLILVLSLLSCKKDNPEPEPEPDSGNTITIDQDGGTYDLENGLRVTIPAGAVSGEKEISIELLNYQTYSGIMLNPAEQASLLLAFEGKPDGTSFSKAITIQASNITLPAGAVPILKELSDQVHPLPDATLEYDSETEILNISLDHFSAKSSEAMNQYAAEQCALEPCKCEKQIIKQGDGDNVCNNGTCQVVESIVSVTYPTCSSDPEVSIYREVTDGCVAGISLRAAESKITIQESTSLTATVNLGCVPIETQSVDFVTDALGSVAPSNVSTDQDGKASATFTANSISGTTSIVANSTISYYKTQVVANGETFNGDLRTVSASDTIQVEIIDSLEIWVGEFRAVFNSCDQMACLNNYNIDAVFSFSLTPSDWDMGYNQEPGSINIAQSGTITPEIDGYIFQNFDIVNKDYEEYHINLDKSSGTAIIPIHTDFDVDTSLIEFDVYFGGTDPEYLVGIWNYPVLTSSPGFDLFRTPLNSDRIETSGPCYFPTLEGSYTLVMTRQ